MFKIFFILTFFHSTLAFSSERVISYEDYIHMSYVNKKKVIHMIHDFLNEYESLERSKQIKLNQKYSFYQKMISKIFSDAHASDSQKLCYYAGWESRMLGNFCNHPFGRGMNETYVQNLDQKYIKVSLSGDEIQLDYESNINCKNSSNKESYRSVVECKPQLYGTLNGRTLCVEHDKNARNASFLCSKAVDKIKAESQSNYDELMSSIVHTSLTAEEDLDNSLKTLLYNLYDNCACGGNATVETKSDFDGIKQYSGRMNPKYVETMFYSRTCFGLLEQSKRIKEKLFNENSCILEHSFNSSSTNWKDFLQRAESLIDNQLASAELVNSDISILKDWNTDERRSSLAKLCPLNDFESELEVEPKSISISEEDGHILLSAVSLTISEVKSISITIIDSSDTQEAQTEELEITDTEAAENQPELVSTNIDGEKLELSESGFKVKFTRGTKETNFQAVLVDKIKSNLLTISPINEEESSLTAQPSDLAIINEKVIRKIIPELNLKGEDKSDTLNSKNLAGLEFNDGDDKYFYTPANQEARKISLKYTGEDQELIHQLQLEAIKTPSCNFSSTKTDEGKEVKIVVNLEDLESLKDSAVIKFTHNGEDKDQQESTFIIKEGEIKAKASIEVADLKYENIVCINKDEDVEEEVQNLADCSIEIIPTEEANGKYSLEAKVKIADEELDLDEVKAKGFIMNWFDTKKQSKRKIAAKSATRTTDSLLTEDEEEEEEEPQKIKNPNGIDKDMFALTNNYFNEDKDIVVGDLSNMIQGLTVSNIERKIAVHLSDSKNECSAVDTFSVPKLKEDGGNDKPVQQQGINTNFGRADGYLIQGTR